MGIYQKITRFLSNYAEKGVPPVLSLDERLRVIMANKMIFVGMTALLGFITVNTLTGRYMSAGLDIILLFILRFSYAMNRLGHDKQGITLSILSANLIIFIPALFEQFHDTYRMMFIGMVGLPFLLLSKEQKLARAISHLLCIAGFSYLTWAPDSWFFYDQTPLSQTYITVFWACMSFMLALMQYHLWETVNVESQRSLQERHSEILENNAVNNIRTMTSGISHEINNPLAIAISSHELMRDRLKSGGQDVMLDKLLRMQEGALTRIRSITSALQDFTSSEIVNAVRSESLVKMCEDAQLFCAQGISVNNVTVKVNGDASVESDVNRVQFIRAITAILENALDALEGNDLAWIQIDITSRGCMNYLKITDNGAGIPLSHRNKIMLPFFTNKDVNQGSGLGLTTALSIVRAEGGNLYLDESAINTTFVIEVPTSTQVIEMAS